MRFQFNSNAVEKLLKDTLQILLFTAIVGCPLSGSHMEIKAMESASTPSSPVASATAVSTYSATPTVAVKPTASDYLETTPATLLELSELPSSSLDSSPDSSLSLSLSSSSSYKSSQIFHSFVIPTSDNSNDSNEIDSNNGMDYVMTKHIASHAAGAAAGGAVTATATAVMTHHHHHHQQPDTGYTATTTNNNKTQDLSSLSLLGLNGSTAATSSNKLSEITGSSSNVNAYTNNKSSNSYSRVAGENGGNGIGRNTATIATFQHIGSQRIALKSTTTATSSAAIGAAAGATATYAGSTAKSNIRTSAKKVESKYILPKPQKTDAPMLNYIFDTFSSANKHHHHDQRYGPHFEDVQRVGQPTNMTVQAGSSIHLNCRISLLQDKTVSWVRRNAQGENALDLLTVGLHTYTGDKRYKMEFQYPNNWRLKITNVKKDDEAMYECQISTHPPRVIQINLLVNAPKVMIVDEFGDPLQEKYYEIDSTLQLSCMVRNVAMAASVVYWKHGEDVLNYDVTRGGISVKTELMDDGANSTLFIAKINKADSGNYTCSISDYQNFSILVHILNGESFAELHHGGATPCCCHHTLAINLMLLLMLLLCLPKYIHR